MTKVFGIGWAKTGTTTLGECLRQLGYRHVSHRFELVPLLPERNLGPIFEVVDQFDSFEDWPWILLYQELDEKYPGSRFVLTTRDESKWIASYRNMLAKRDIVPEEENVRRRILYGLPFPDVTDEQLIERYRRHHDDVRKYFAGRPESLLEVNWGQGDGWPQLCRFLNVPEPDAPFPHANKARYVKRSFWDWTKRR